MGFDNKYPYTDFHELNLDWFLQEFNKLLQEWADLAADNAEFKQTMTERFGTLSDTVQEFTTFVTNYFDNLDVQQEINHKLNDMVVDGTMSELLRPYFNAFTVEINARMRNQDDKITVLEGRMDTFTHLDQGSTSGDAELQDIRVGINGYIYNTAGNAVRSEVSDVDNKIEDLIDGEIHINILDGNWVDNKTINNFGEYADISNARNYGDGVVDLRNYAGMTLKLKLKNTLTTQLVYAIRNSNSELLAKETISSNTNVTIPADAKEFRLAALASDVSNVAQSKATTEAYIISEGASIRSMQGSVAELPSIKQEISNIKDEIEPIITKEVETANYIVNGVTGAISPSAIALTIQGKIKLADFDSFTMDSGYSIKIHEFKRNQEYIGLAHWGLVTYTTTTSEPVKKSDITFDDETYYIIIQIQTNRVDPQTIEPDDVTVYLSLLTKRIDILEDETIDINFAYAMTSTLCIGDSLTSGAYYGDTDIWPNTGTSIKQNYPNMLARMLTNKTMNGGVSGYDAQNWYLNKYAEMIDDTNTDPDKWFDSVIIWLGTNGGYTDTFDTDVEQYGDTYENYAETNVGYLGKIIQRIKTYHPDTFITICNLYAEPNASKASNKVIAEAAEFFNIPLIDMSDLDTFNHPELHYGSDHLNVHFNKAGNIVIADRIMKSVYKYLKENKLACDFGLTVRDDEYYHP